MYIPRYLYKYDQSNWNNNKKESKKEEMEKKGVNVKAKESIGHKKGYNCYYHCLSYLFTTITILLNVPDIHQPYLKINQN